MPLTRPENVVVWQNWFEKRLRPKDAELWTQCICRNLTKQKHQISCHPRNAIKEQLYSPAKWE